MKETPSFGLETAKKLLHKHRREKLVVVDTDFSCVGLITVKDIEKAQLEKIEPMEVVQRYTVDFHNILKRFNFLPPSIEPTATCHIIAQIEIIKQIIEKGFAYEFNGSVYFDVLKYNQENNYGILSGRKIEDLIFALVIPT